MTNSSSTVVLLPLRQAPTSQLVELQTGIALLELAPGQDAFVGDPVQMVQCGLEDPGRHPFAIVPSGIAPDAQQASVIGMGILHVDAATDAGWPDADGAVLLRGFLVDHRHQGLGYGRAATLAAVELAKELVQELQLPAKGVVLGVNERNTVARSAYLKAGFVDHGRYLGSRSGAQHIMFKAF